MMVTLFASKKISSVTWVVRGPTGVKGVNLREGDFVVGSSTINDSQEVLVVSENGLGKRTSAEQYQPRAVAVKGSKS